MATASPTGRLLGVPDLAAYLGITEHALRAMVKRGQVPVTRIGRKVYFDTVEVDAWIHRSTVRPDGRVA